MQKTTDSYKTIKVESFEILIFNDTTLIVLIGREK